MTLRLPMSAGSSAINSGGADGGPACCDAGGDGWFA